MSLTTTPPRVTSGIRTPRNRRGPLLLMGLWVLLMIALAVVAPVVQDALGVPWELLPLIMLGPAIASAAVLLVARRRPTPWPAVSARDLVSPVLLALLWVGVFTGVTALLVGGTPVLPSRVAGVPLAVFVLLQTVGALGEELGWRGLMQRLGEEVAPPPLVTLVLGTLFGATHVGLWGRGPVFLAWFTLSSVLMCVSITVVWRGGFWQRMVPATLVHTGANLAVLALLADGFPTGWIIVVPGAAGLAAVALVRWALATAPARRSTAAPGG